MNFNEWFEYKIAHHQAVARAHDTLILVLSIICSICGIYFASKAVSFNLLLTSIFLIVIGVASIVISNLFGYEKIAYPFSHIVCVLGMKEFVHVLSSSFYNSKGDTLAYIIIAIILSILMSATLMVIVTIFSDNDYDGVYGIYYISMYALLIYIIPIIELAYKTKNSISLIFFVIMVIIAVVVTLIHTKSKK